MATLVLLPGFALQLGLSGPSVHANASTPSNPPEANAVQCDDDDLACQETAMKQRLASLHDLQRHDG